MKIGIVCYPSLGGSGIVATELGHTLAAQGHEIHFITYEIPFRLRLEDRNIYFHEVDIYQHDLFKYPDYALTLAVKIAQVSEIYDLDIVHVHYAIPHATSAYLAKQILGTKKPKVITTLHGTDITLIGKDPAYFRIVKFSIENSCGITAVSQWLKQQTTEYFGIKQPIEVIYNFFTPNPEILNKKPMRHLYVNFEEKLLLHSSNYRAVKRPVDVVRIFAEVRKHVKCKLLFLGTGGGLADVRQAVLGYKLEKEVFFLGNNRNIDPYVSSADLFLLPSSMESFGLAALEAMAYGVPVVSTNVGGLPELMEQGVSGFMAPVGDIQKMADYCVQLLQDPVLYQNVSKAAQKRASEKFCMEKILPQYVKCYEKYCP